MLFQVTEIYRIDIFEWLHVCMVLYSWHVGHSDMIMMTKMGLMTWWNWGYCIVQTEKADQVSNRLTYFKVFVRWRFSNSTKKSQFA